MNSSYRPSFGWLLLGLAWGVIIGHLMAAHLLISVYSPHGFLRLWALTLLGGGAVGLGGGVVVDSLGKRSTNWLDWAALGVAFIVAVLLLPQVNVAHE